MGLPWPGAACEGYTCVAGLYHCTENVKHKIIPISRMSYTFTVRIPAFQTMYWDS